MKNFDFSFDEVAATTNNRTHYMCAMTKITGKCTAACSSAVQLREIQAGQLQVQKGFDFKSK